MSGYERRDDDPANAASSERAEHEPSVEREAAGISDAASAGPAESRPAAATDASERPPWAPAAEPAERAGSASAAHEHAGDEAAARAPAFEATGNELAADEAAPDDTAPDEPAPAARETVEPAANAAGADDDEPTLSPSVRRLVKQYDLDVTGVRGTGPGGRIRVGDVMALLGGRDGPAEESAARPAARAREPAAKTGPASAPAAEPGNGHAVPAEHAGAWPPAAAAPVTTTVFECDAGRILEDQRRHREQGREIALSAYFVASFARALRETHALAADGGHRIPALGVDTRDGTHVLTDADTSTVEQISVALNAPVVASTPPVVLIRHHGLGGSLLVQSERLAPEHAAVLGIGRIRRQVVVRVVDGEEAPRIASRCLLSLSFRESLTELRTANELLARCVANVERWRVVTAPAP